ncbi:anti-sigma factor family protein [Prosthecobacter sp.]|uniref:anti-sigma factor family protein n=1 Tax=Prosthecobacter sp. TaxID=1965333 RepID=UPI0037850698
MKHPSEEHDLIRWLDGEMSETERTQFEESLKQDAALAREAQNMRALSATLRAHLPAEIRVPHADYFNTQIGVRITQMALDDARAKQVGTSWGSILQWMRQPWFALAGTAAVAVLSFSLMKPAEESTTQSRILSSYTPNVNVQAHAYHDSNADATVLMLDGLDAVPAAKKISGISVHHSELEPELAETTMFDDQGAALLQISRDSLGNPVLFPRG